MYKYFQTPYDTLCQLIRKIALHIDRFKNNRFTKSIQYMLNLRHKRSWLYRTVTNLLNFLLFLQLCSWIYVSCILQFLNPFVVNSLYKSFYYWSAQIFYYRKDNPNANVSFHRFENQGCHTVHIHMLVWLKSVKQVDMDRIRASIPSDVSYVAYLVRLFFVA